MVAIGRTKLGVGLSDLRIIEAGCGRQGQGQKQQPAHVHTIGCALSIPTLLGYPTRSRISMPVLSTGRIDQDGVHPTLDLPAGQVASRKRLSVASGKLTALIVGI